MYPKRSFLNVCNGFQVSYFNNSYLDNYSVVFHELFYLMIPTI